MGIFDLFTTSQEKKVNDLINNRPQFLMHTSNHKMDKIYSIKPSVNAKKNQPVVFATDDEKKAILYTLYPFYYFEFGKGELGAIILGKNHNLLNIDKTVGYIYYVDSSSFTPEVDEQGNYKNEWFSLNEVLVNKSMAPKEVKFEDVLKAGIQVFWVNDRATMLSIDKETSTLTTGDQKLEFLVNQASWTPGKFMYLNDYKNICQVVQTDKGLVVDRGQVNTKTNNNVEEKIEVKEEVKPNITPQNQIPQQPNNQQIPNMNNNINQYPNHNPQQMQGYNRQPYYPNMKYMPNDTDPNSGGITNNQQKTLVNRR